MAGAIRLVSIERGHDPQKFVAMPFGGGGALHVGALIREIGLKCALVPRFPGITSALGCVLADLRHDMVQTVNLMLDGLQANALETRMAAAGREASDVIEAAGIPVERVDVIYELDMHYLGQTHTVAVPLPVAADAQGVSEELVRKAFETAYSASFSRLLPGLGGAHRVAARRRDRTAAGVRFLGVRAGGVERARHGEDRIAQRVVSRRLARDQRVVAARAAGGRRRSKARRSSSSRDATTVIEPGHVARVDRARQRDRGERMSKQRPR